MITERSSYLQITCLVMKQKAFVLKTIVVYTVYIYSGIYCIYSILHILAIVFPGTCNVKYLPIFNGSYSMLSCCFS